MTLVAYEIDCAKLVDLRRTDTRAVLNVSIDDLACAWEALANGGETPPTWVLADRISAAGAHGAVVPSQAPGARDDAANLVFWRHDGECRVDVIDDFGRLGR